MIIPNGVPDVDLILFDLDNTLYRRDLGLWEQIDERIAGYVRRLLDLPLAEAREVQKRYWQQYGTTIAGLMAEHGVDPAPYLAYVHDVNVGRYLRPNTLLAQTLAALPYRKAIFTNATAGHAHNVLTALGVREHFESLIGTEQVGFVPKPNPLAYTRCLALLEVIPHRCLFIEDSPVNLGPARKLGMPTALLGQPDQGEADYYLESIEEIGPLFRVHPGTSVSA